MKEKTLEVPFQELLENGLVFRRHPKIPPNVQVIVVWKPQPDILRTFIEFDSDAFGSYLQQWFQQLADKIGFMGYIAFKLTNKVFLKVGFQFDRNCRSILFVHTANVGFKYLKLKVIQISQKPFGDQGRA
jgi:hypothetical protein